MQLINELITSIYLQLFILLDDFCNQIVISINCRDRSEFISVAYSICLLCSLLYFFVFFLLSFVINKLFLRYGPIPDFNDTNRILANICGLGKSKKRKKVETGRKTRGGIKFVICLVG